MYTIEDRQQLLDDLRSLAEGIERVQGMILVGSGAYGYRDRYSDLDVVVAVDESSQVPAVHHALVSALGRDYWAWKHKVYRHESDIFVSCFLFPGYLELDLGVWSLRKLRATKAHWQVIFDRRAPELLEQLRRTLPASVPNLEETARDSMTYMWQFMRGALVAMRRGNYIKAFKEMEYIRDKVSELAALREGVYHDVAKELGRLTPAFVERLGETYAGTMDWEGSVARMRDLVALYTDVLADILGANAVQAERTMAFGMIHDLILHRE